MGCEAAREVKHDSEIALTRLEGALGFGGLSASNFASTVKSFSRKRQVRLKDLGRLLAAVDLPTGFLTATSCPLFIFYRLHSAKRNFSVSVLGTLGVLLGSDSPEAKVRVLFNIYDTHSSGKLGPREIYELTTTACKIALLYIPKYAEMELRTLRDLEALQKHQKLMVRLEKRVLVLAADLNAALLQGEPTLTESQFAVHVLKHCECLLTATTLRQHALGLSEEQVAAFVPQQPAGFEPLEVEDSQEDEFEDED